MGRSTEDKGGLGNEYREKQPLLFPASEIPASTPKLPDKNFKSLRFPLWTENKARLIQEYLRLFEFITHHGTYIDGFAAPQYHTHTNAWAAKLVLEMEPKWFREFWLCDIDKVGVEKLRSLKQANHSENRRVEILEGDFNDKVDEILKAGTIKDTTATFALLDQRTFECDWKTVVALSKHKTKTKIELFYFFPTGWIDRSLAAIKAPATIERVTRWWGRNDYVSLRKMDSIQRALLVAKRFEDELGYGKATVYPIHSEKRRGRVMYHMIHATDHPEATSLMVRAYRKISGRSELSNETQLDIEAFLKRINQDDD